MLHQFMNVKIRKTTMFHLPDGRYLSLQKGSEGSIVSLNEKQTEVDFKIGRQTFRLKVRNKYLECPISINGDAPDL